MIDGKSLIKIVQSMTGGMVRSPEERKPTRWKICVALAANGWKAIKSEPVGNQHDIMVIWHKDGRDDVEIRLNFANQALWLDYMYQKELRNDRKI
jgi:hypothetical protein